jgi:hypothetical protein
MRDKMETPSRPKGKKLPFKTTVLCKVASQNVETIRHEKLSAEDDGLDLFRRSKEMEPIIAAELQRSLKKKQRLEDERRQSAKSKRPLDDNIEREVIANAESGTFSQAARSTSPVASELVKDSREIVRLVYICAYLRDMGVMQLTITSKFVTPLASKRMRLDSTLLRNTSLDMDNADTTLNNLSSTRFLRSHPKQPKINSLPGDTLTSNGLPMVLLDSDDEDSTQVAPTPTNRRDSVCFIARDEDDEFAHYIRKAEEQRVQDGSYEAAAKEKIDILVTSIVPGTKPCCFKFLYDKQLRLVRNAWLTLQKHRGVLLDIEKDDDIVLTWCRKKAYAFSTLLNMGIRPHGDGRAIVDGHSTSGLAHGRTKVHIEAWTLDLFREMEREEALKRRRETVELLDEGGPVPVEREPVTSEVKIRVILKARDLDDVKMTVRPETTVGTLITSFRTQRSIGPDKYIGVWFDGDILEEHATMEEAEIDDMDTFEVHIK